MTNYEQLKADIAAVVRANGIEDITGDRLQQVLMHMVDVLGNDYALAGVATPTTNPPTPDGNTAYIAGTSGTYTYFLDGNHNPLVVPSNCLTALLMYDASAEAWTAYPFGTIAQGTIGTNELADGAVTTPKIANSAVTTPKINDGAVSEQKLATALQNKINNAVTLDGAQTITGSKEFTQPVALNAGANSDNDLDLEAADNVSIRANGGTMELSSDDDMTINAHRLIINNPMGIDGDVSVIGDINATGDVDASGDIKVNGKVYANINDELATKDYTDTQLATKQDTIADLSTIRAGAALGATAYQKPSGGIPESDLSASVQTSLGKADTALQDIPDGSVTIAKIASAAIDATPTEGSHNLVESGGVYTSVKELDLEINGLSITNSMTANGTVKDMATPLPQGAIITSVTGLNDLPTTRIVLYEDANDTTGTYVYINTQLPFTLDKTYRRWRAYQSGSPTVALTAVIVGLDDRIETLEGDVADLISGVSELGDYSDLFSDLELVQDGAVLTTSGTISSSAYTTDYEVKSLDLTGKDYDYIVIQMVYGGSGWSFACGYDSDGNFVTSYGAAVSGGSPAYITIFPEAGIKTIKFTLQKSLESDYSLSAFQYGRAFDNYDTGAARTHTIYVSPTDSLVDVLKTLSNDTSSTKPSKKHNYEIILQAGDYDMDCSDQVGTLPRGVFVPPYTTIRGCGQSETKLKYLYQGTNDSVMSEHSVLNMPYTSKLYNMTIEAENIRYAIHSDLAETGKEGEWTNSVIELHNVDVIHHGITNGETPTTNNPAAWGGGTTSGQVRRFYGCKFVADMWCPFSNHDRSTNTSSQYFEFENCEFIAPFVTTDMSSDYSRPSVFLNSWGSGVPVYVNFVNCYANKWVEFYEGGTYDSDYYVKTDNELLFHYKENTANPQNKKHYITGGCREFIFTSATTKGTPIVMTDSRSARAATASDARAMIYGVLIHDVDAGGVGVVMRSGMFAVEQVVGVGFSAGDTIGWNGTAWAVAATDYIAVLLTSKIAILIQ